MRIEKEQWRKACLAQANFWYKAAAKLSRLEQDAVKN
jgi:hypothetical protein